MDADKLDPAVFAGLRNRHTRTLVRNRDENLTRSTELAAKVRTFIDRFQQMVHPPCPLERIDEHGWWLGIPNREWLINAPSCAEQETAIYWYYPRAVTL